MNGCLVPLRAQVVIFSLLGDMQGNGYEGYEGSVSSLLRFTLEPNLEWLLVYNGCDSKYWR